MTQAAPVLAGHLDLEASPSEGGRTVLSSQSFRAPFHIGKSYWDGRALQIRVVNPTAGILAGDRLDLAVRVRPGATLLMTTPSATRIFTMRDGSSARCAQTLAVGDGASLEYAPEPLYPHRGSDFVQETRIEAARGAHVCWIDSLAPGRAGRGECWAWRRLVLGLSVSVAGEPVLIERLDVSGDDMRRRAAFFGRDEAWFATVVILSPALEAAAGDLAAWGAAHAGDCWAAATRLREGAWVARVVAPNAIDLRDSLAALRIALARTLPFLKSDLRRV